MSRLVAELRTVRSQFYFTCKCSYHASGSVHSSKRDIQTALTRISGSLQKDSLMLCLEVGYVRPEVDLLVLRRPLQGSYKTTA